MKPGSQPAQIGEVGGDSFSYKDQTVVKRGRLYFYYLTMVADKKGNVSGTRE